jgi:hypothetical protein
MKNIFRSGKGVLKKVTAVVAAAAFFLSYVAPEASAIFDTADAVYDAEMDEVSSSGEYAMLDVDTFTIPAHLGEVRYSHRGTGDRVIIHLQDAHCNYFAQHKISGIIDYLSKEYGINMLNLEGGAGYYDLEVFTNISGDEIRREVADYFLKRGEVNGAEFYAINNPDKVSLWGIESKELYLKNLKIYRDSLEYKEEVQAYIKELTHIFGNLKRHIFPPELLKMDTAYNSYKAGKMDFREYLEFLIAKARGNGISVKKFPNIYLIAQAMEKEQGVDFKKANSERSVLIDRMKSILSQAEIRELISTTVSFKTKRISLKVFYNYLLKKARECGLDTSSYPALSSYIVYVSLFDAVDRFQIMEELDQLESAVKEPMFRNDTERELDLLSRNLALTANIFDLLLTKTDFGYYLSHKDHFTAQSFIGFIDKEAPKYGITARLSQNISNLDMYLAEIIMFYEYSFKRDEAFLENMLFKEAPTGGQAAVIMTGGFHTENLCVLFQEKGYSYVSIMPKFTMDKDFVNPYFDLLAGQTADVQQMLRSALAQSAMMQIASMFNSLGSDVWGAEGVDSFKASVIVVEAILRERGFEALRNGISAIIPQDGNLIVVIGGEEATPVQITINDIMGKVAPAQRRGAETIEEKIQSIIDLYTGKNIGDDRLGDDQRREILEALKDLGVEDAVAEKVLDNFNDSLKKVIRQKLTNRNASILRNNQGDLVGQQGMTMEAYQLEDPDLGSIVIKFPRTGLLQDGVSRHYEHVFLRGRASKDTARREVDAAIAFYKDTLIREKGLSEREAEEAAKEALSETAKKNIADTYDFIRRKLGNLFAPLIVQDLTLSVERVGADGSVLVDENGDPVREQISIPYAIVQQRVTPLKEIISPITDRQKAVEKEISSLREDLQNLGMFGKWGKYVGKENRARADGINRRIQELEEENAELDEQLWGKEEGREGILTRFYRLVSIMGERGVVDKDSALNFRNNYGVTPDGRIVGFDADYYSIGSVAAPNEKGVVSAGFEGEKFTALVNAADREDIPADIRETLVERMDKFNEEHRDVWASLPPTFDSIIRERLGNFLKFVTGNKEVMAVPEIKAALQEHNASVIDVTSGRVTGEALDDIIESVVLSDMEARAPPEEVAHIDTLVKERKATSEAEPPGGKVVVTPDTSSIDELNPEDWERYKGLLDGAARFMGGLPKEDIVGIARKVTGDSSLAPDTVSEDILVQYFAEGAHKHVFKVEMKNADGRTITAMLALKKSKGEGAITETEIRDLQSLKGRGVPMFGEILTDDDGNVWFFEEFIQGKTVAEKVFDGSLTRNMRLNVVRALLSISSLLGYQMPKDAHDYNFIIREGTEEAVMVDIGNNRVNIGENGSARDKAIGLFMMMEQYGWSDRRDLDKEHYLKDILDVLSETLGRDEALKTLQEIAFKYGGKQNEKELRKLTREEFFQRMMQIRQPDGKILTKGKGGVEKATKMFIAAVNDYLRENQMDTGPPITGNISSGLDKTAKDGEGKTEEDRWRENSSMVESEVAQGTRESVGAAAADLLDRKEADIRAALEGKVPADQIDKIIRILNVLAGRAEPLDATQSMGWMMARAELVDGNEKYLLGNQSALAADIIEYLTLYQNRNDITEDQKSDLVAEYVLHEIMENTALDHPDIIAATTSIFGRGAMGVDFERPGETPLGIALRAFIDTKLVTSAAIGVARNLRQGNNVNVTVIPVKGDQLLWDGNTLNSLKGAARRKFRKLGVNDFVYYYDVDADPTVELADIAKKIVNIKGFNDDDKSRVVVYADSSQRKGIESQLSGIKETGKLTGVIPGTFKEGSVTERTSVVTLAVLGLGLMEWDRAKGEERQADIADSIRELFVRMVSDPDTVEEYISEKCANDPNAFIQNLIAGDFTMRIKKIDFEEIRDFMESESAVLKSL